MDSDIYNADELISPTWMDKNFFETVLRNAKSGNIKKVIEYKVGPATVKGDHFASVMFRGIVQYLDETDVNQEISLIIKTMPELDGAKMDFLKESTVFEVEIEMFRDVIPKFEEMLRAAGDNTRLSANMLYYTLSPRKVIVLEDITKIGYTAIRQKSSTMEENVMNMDILAKWHACSYIYNKKTEGSLEKFKNGVFDIPVEVNSFLNKGTEQVVAIAKKTPQLRQYVEKLEKIQDVVAKKCRNVYDLCRRRGRINVLVHGDFHSKNLMYKINPNCQLTEKVILVDFQLCVWTSMAIDLLYYMHMAIDSETREKYRDELVYNHFQKFLEALKLLGYKGKMPKFVDLQIDMFRICCVEVYLATTFLPLIITAMENPKFDPDGIWTTEEGFLNLYKSETFIKELEIILKSFLHKGVLDNLNDDDDYDD